MDPQNQIQSKCSSLLVFVYKHLGRYQSNLSWKKDLDGNENSYQSTYLKEKMEWSSYNDGYQQIMF